MNTVESIDSYLYNQPKDIQVTLQKLRHSIQDVVHYAAFKKHISLFPGASGVQAFEEQLTGYITSKGTIQFPLQEPLPMELISEIVKFRISETLEKVSPKTSK